MKKTFTAFIFIYFISILSYGQRMPFFIHHATNPYLYNPAFAGSENCPVLFTTHRQQWIGVEGAPVSSNLSFHMPTGYANPISLGADITSDRIGILNNTVIRATFAYLLSLGTKHEHFIRFGLSAGVGLQQFNLTDANINDDYFLQNSLRKKTFYDGRFGFQYHIKNLNLGFALPHIFSNPLLSSNGFNTIEADPLSRFIASANYHFNLSATENLIFEPILLYHFSKEMENQLEAFGVLHIRDALWIGGGYQQHTGVAGIMGFKIKSIKAGYGYGTGSSSINGISSGTHEVQLSITLGKKQEVIKRSPRFSISADGDKMPEDINSGKR